jgi:hypothetical protein
MPGKTQISNGLLLAAIAHSILGINDNSAIKQI